VAKKSQATKKSAQQAVSISRLKLNQLFFESLLIVQGFFGIFIFIALYSFSPEDPGWNSQTFGEEFIISNSVGSWGAFLSDFLYSTIGLMSFLVPYWLLWPLLRHFLLFRKPIQFPQIYSVFLLIRIFGWSLVLISGATLMSIYVSPGTTFGPLETGGLLGKIVSIQTLNPLSEVGRNLLFICLGLLGLTLSFDISWTAIITKLQEYLVKFGGDFGEKVSHFLSKINERQKIYREKSERQQKIIEDSINKEKSKKPEIIKQIQTVEKSQRADKERQKDLFEYKESSQPPKLSLLDERLQDSSHETSQKSGRKLGELLISKLAEYGINEVTVESVQPGPVVIRLELNLPSGLKISQVTSINKDLARSLSKTSVRIVEVIEGKDTIGIEIPREDRESVLLSEVLSSIEYDNSKSPLTIALGKDISGSAVVAELSSMPHLLLAGTTGSGKSIALNSMLISILYKANPEEVRLILIDPKMLELSVYEDIPHLLCPVITDMKKASNGLRWCVNEMERRYLLMAELGVRNLNGYNKKVLDSIKSGSPIKDPLWKNKHLEETELEPPDLEKLPAIVIAIDELADLMMMVGKTAEQLIARLAQKARAAGIHMLIATQRPSVDVITGLIKANISARIAFQVASQMDSRVILDQGGAEQLLGNGDMLYLAAGTSIPQRVHGAFVGDDEVKRVVDDWRQRGKAVYIDKVIQEEGVVVGMPNIPSGSDSGDNGEADELYDEAVDFVATSRRASISAVQRKLRIGYNRAARLIETMELQGIVSPMASNGNREVLVSPPSDDL
tara:strand:- start:33 stop:2399 length:2367 start_codon:yes stop_codon:yes gene_type:complete